MSGLTKAKKTGNLGEQIAETYLNAKGLITQSKNFSCPMGELDLVMRDKNQLVFVEVKYRKNNLFGSAVEHVTRSKQIKIRKAAQAYIQRFKLFDVPVRFDALGITGNGTDTPDIQWIPNAFTGA